MEDKQCCECEYSYIDVDLEPCAHCIRGANKEGSEDKWKPIANDKDQEKNIRI